MSEALEVVRNDVPVEIDRDDPISIVKYALSRDADVSVIERVMAVRRELNAERSKRLYDEAMAAFQSEVPTIDKPKSVPTRDGKVAFTYAPLEYVIATVKPFLLKHGFSYTLDTDVASEVGWVIAKCHITHRAGHTQTSTAKFPLGTQTAIMSATQAYAAALTFASRRVFCNAFGLVPSGEDMLEANAARMAKPQGPSAMQPPVPALKALAKELWDLLKDVRGTEKNWVKANQWLWQKEILDGAVPENAPELSEKRFKEVIERVKTQLKL